MEMTSPFAWMAVGHWTDTVAQTGCTVVRFLGDVVASGEVRGGAPATREFSLLEPTRMVESVHAVCMSGGSAFGLAAGDGVARSLRRQEIGFETDHGKVPIVVGMSLYDLGVGNAMRWPGAPEGEAALDAAAARPEVASPLGQNTTIGVIATNADLSKTQCRSLAEAGHDGLARALVPAHGPSDGDALVAVAKPEVEADLASTRLLVSSVVQQAIVSMSKFQ